MADHIDTRDVNGAPLKIAAIEQLDQDGVTLAKVQEVLDLASLHVAQMVPPRALQHARDPNDRMKVIIDNANASAPGASTSVLGNLAAVYMWSTSSTNQGYVGWYGQPQGKTIDERESQREYTMQTFKSTRSRWTVT